MPTLLSPGEAIHVPNLIDPELAIKVGSMLRPLCTVDISPSLVYPVNDFGEQDSRRIDLDGRLTEDLARIDDAVFGTMSSHELIDSHTSVSYAKFDHEHYGWHIDTVSDIRALVNVSEGTASVMLSRQGVVAEFDEVYGIYIATPDDEDVVTVDIEPGGAYFIDNRTQKRLRMPHDIPKGSVGRTMLRYDMYTRIDDVSPTDFSRFTDAVLIQPDRVAA